MTAQVIDGKAFAQKICDEIKAEWEEKFKPLGKRKVGLAVVLVGEDPASEIYVRNKGIKAEQVGFFSETLKLSANSTQQEVLAVIDRLNKTPSIDGILVQLPLPKHLDSKEIISAIDPKKDVDGFHPENIGRLWQGNDFANFPVACTPLGCYLILKELFGDEGLRGKNAVMIGASNVVGKPMAGILLKKEATITLCHIYTQNIEEIAKTADILIVATGNPHLVKKEWVKEGAVVLDVGINRITQPDGKTKLVGDVDFEAVKEIASAITPVPGGIGPMTIACLMKNTFDAYKRELAISN